jgi:hypothetical protein
VGHPVDVTWGHRRVWGAKTRGAPSRNCDLQEGRYFGTPPLEGADVYGAILVIDFADRSWRVALTRDYEMFRPVVELRELNAVA